MPNIKSAVKRVKTTQTAEERNISQKNEMRTACLLYTSPSPRDS